MRLRRAITTTTGAVILATCSSVMAATIFTENFNSPSGENQNANQATTNLPVAFGGDFASWAEAGSGTAHLVDRGGANSWALMLWQGPALNVLTSASIAGGNVAGQHYAINFQLAPAVYAGITQATDDAVAAYTDGIYVEVLDSANTVMTIQQFKPGTFASQASAGSLPFAPFSMTYVGTGVGVGEVTLRLSANNAGAGRFGGAVDNLAVSTALFTENFNEPTGTFNAAQFTTGLPVAFGGNLTNWSEAGAGTTHLVERTPGAPERNQAAMFYNGATAPDMNQIQSVAIAGGNIAGYQYALDFELAPATYNSGTQSTTATDAMVVQLVDSLNQVVATNTYFPGAFAASATLGNLAFVPISFNYTGDGAGDDSISIRLLPNFAGSDKFGGAIDNVVLSLVAVPEPATLGLLATGAILFTRKFRRRSAAY